MHRALVWCWRRSIGTGRMSLKLVVLTGLVWDTGSSLCLHLARVLLRLMVVVGVCSTGGCNAPVVIGVLLSLLAFMIGPFMHLLVTRVNLLVVVNLV